MAGLLKAQIQLGDSATATNNFVITSAAANGTMRLARGNDGVTTQDIMVVDATGKVSFPMNSNSMVRLSLANGFGSTYGNIRRFTNIITYTGTDITYTDSTTLGSSFTINTAGVYSVVYTDELSAAQWTALSMNCTNPTATAFTLIAANELLGTAYNGTGTAATTAHNVMYFAAGSIIRPHAWSTAGASNQLACMFTIVRVA